MNVFWRCLRELTYHRFESRGRSALGEYENSRLGEILLTFPRTGRRK
jgi:hypothetical protein